MVHRDLKPSNVLMAPDGVRVIDFGISRPADSDLRTETGKLIGTPPFMAPEQFQSPREVGTAADVFALGAVLVHAATGRGPFDSDSHYLVAYQVVHGEPDLTGLPEPLVPLVARCLAKDPARRPTADALIAQMRALAYPTGEDTQVFTPQPRRPAPAEVDTHRRERIGTGGEDAASPAAAWGGGAPGARAGPHGVGGGAGGAARGRRRRRLPRLRDGRRLPRADGLHGGAGGCDEALRALVGAPGGPLRREGQRGLLLGERGAVLLGAGAGGRPVGPLQRRPRVDGPGAGGARAGVGAGSAVRGRPRPRRRGGQRRTPGPGPGDRNPALAARPAGRSPGGRGGRARPRGRPDGSATLLDAATGTPKWSRRIGGTGSVWWGGPDASGRAALYVATRQPDGRQTQVAAVDPGDGAVRWQIRTAGLLQPVATVQGSAYLLENDAQGKTDAVVRVDLATRAVRRVRLAVPLYEAQATAGPDGVVYLVGAAGGLAAVGPERELWRLETGLAVASRPAVAAGRVYLTAPDGRLLAVEASGGRLLGQTKPRMGGDQGAFAASLNAPVVADGTVYASAPDGSVFAVDAADPAGW